MGQFIHFVGSVAMPLLLVLGRCCPTWQSRHVISEEFAPITLPLRPGGHSMHEAIVFAASADE